MRLSRHWQSCVLGRSASWGTAQARSAVWPSLSVKSRGSRRRSRDRAKPQPVFQVRRRPIFNRGADVLKENELVGAFFIYRTEVRPFTDKQIELAKNFAAQAVIAIENARLLKELRQRTSDLTEALEQQTATSDVLRIVSSSPGELEPVFQAMLENATRICEANFGNLWLREGDAFRTVVMHGATAEYTEARQARRSFGLALAPGLPACCKPSRWFK
jgi:hypothetical protein